MTSFVEERQAIWRDAGYDEKMASAIACLPPAPHLIRLYHLTSEEHAVSDLEFGRLKVARFSDLNDPFELIGVNFRERDVRVSVRDFKISYDGNTGLICFSENWADPVLWSHYAKKHRGVCLGFNVARDSVQKINYEDNRILAGLDETGGSPFGIGDELQNKLQCTKFRRWEYEKERRRFVPLKEAIQVGNLHFVPFGSDLELAEVILGPQCTADLNDISRLVRINYPKAIVYKARLAFKSFDVVPQESSIPGFPDLNHSFTASAGIIYTATSIVD